MTRVPTILVLAAVALLGPAAATPVPDFSGTWVRDQRRSDDPLEKVKEAAAPTVPRGGGGGGTGPGGGVGPGGGWGRGGGGNGPGGGSFPGPGGTGTGGGPGGVYIPIGRHRGGPRGGGGNGNGASGDSDRLAHLAHGIEAWQIEHGEPELQVRDANRETRVLFTDGRTVGDALGTRTTATWRGISLEVETRGSFGAMTETWTLDAEGQRLMVSTVIEPSRGEDLSFQTVYERVGDAHAVPAGKDAGAAEAKAAPRAAGGGPSDVPTPQHDPSAAPSTPASPRDPLDEPSPPAWAPDDHRQVVGSTIRLLPVRAAASPLAGKVLFETLTLDPEVAAVEFFLDGERVERRAWPPFEAKLTLADPPREQTVRVIAFAANDRVLGDDQVVVNRVEPPFRVRIASIARAPGDTFEVKAEVSTPRRAELAKVAFYLGGRDVEERPLQELSQPPFTVRIPADTVQPEAFVRAVLTLRDGREREDVSLLQEGVFTERVDVHLVELQVLVTDHTGAAVAGLHAEDFDILEGGRSRRPENLYPAGRVALLLGLAIDSSGSMWPLWDQTRSAANYFLDHTLETRDRAFLVDFDSRLRLLQAPTGQREELAWALERMEPHGGTALYDSILFSLLQYDGEHGRRALVVLTDGFDSESKSDPRRTIDLGRRLGVPVYVIAMDGSGGSALGPGMRRSSASIAESAELAAARNQLKLVTDPTGGRLFHVITPDQVARAFAEIQDELQRQYVLTYYSERPPDEGAAPVVKVRRGGLEVRSAVPLDNEP